MARVLAEMDRLLTEPDFRPIDKDAAGSCASDDSIVARLRLTGLTTDNVYCQAGTLAAREEKRAAEGKLAAYDAPYAS
jgi:hypothetical protein